MIKTRTTGRLARRYRQARPLQASPGGQLHPQVPRVGGDELADLAAFEALFGDAGEGADLYIVWDRDTIVEFSGQDAKGGGIRQRVQVLRPVWMERCARHARPHVLRRGCARDFSKI